MDYDAFIASKGHQEVRDGFEPDALPDYLFPFQRDLVAWALQAGRGAIFSDCGTGKSPMQLCWADLVGTKTGKPVLIATPLAVAFQTVTEAEKFGVEAAVSRDGKVKAPVTVTNYDRLHLFDPYDYGAMVCDESSAIKSYEGRRKALVTDMMRRLPYRLLCTATAAPNDYVELGTSSEALGHLGYMDMLTRFFVNDQRTSAQRGWGNSSQWRFKGHGEDQFWRWVSSWARAMRRPSDLGFSDDGFQLPALVVNEHVVQARVTRDGSLFDMPAVGLQEEREEQRRTIGERCEQAAALLADAGSAVAWCQLNPEGDRLTRLIDGAVQVKGADDPQAKEEALVAFSRGEIRVLVTKPSIGAWGLNWQHCNRMTYFPNHSYEQWYQAVRRSWRFGQQNPVTVDVVTTEGGAGIRANLERKAGQADRMFEALVAHMRDAMHVAKETTYDETVEAPSWLTSLTN